jgi:hypothetical protein
LTSFNVPEHFFSKDPPHAAIISVAEFISSGFMKSMPYWHWMKAISVIEISGDWLVPTISQPRVIDAKFLWMHPIISTPEDMVADPPPELPMRATWYESFSIVYDSLSSPAHNSRLSLGSFREIHTVNEM